ncbi:EF-P lysine aminoacylase GenX [Cereibacter sphaeroides]|uniref:EF-P lysine aminoacylase EpmA n=1 Tax=Cereibacter sphaeroides TaxID=1063 RepID=UPI001EEE3FC5|nr:EF-P lysine aminoacylase EpmA [Cereibacter sphaeroides]MCE6949828.1 EF-P lysine aminoacylase GenX [Cereibacter sphaeroides]MCE6958986.1 EF-P lysine aminoacylase GenX [Cereibacter sphaeroides]MCE6969050.1 EF-P lysine aminoacylase GenX [Cereibacter sphaeroides]MCE6973672.1 EF-P lysine aminoacylase GenX [Cereibacter sphaeroides]
MSASSWWQPHRHADRRPLLLARNRIQSAIRGWLAVQGFTEVDPAALQVSPGNEAHLHGFETAAIGNDGLARRMYLHTSPEFAMKKLLAAGETRIAAFAHVWRNRERGALHSPEFTMLEWYRVGEPYEVLMEDCAAFLRLAAEAAGATTLRFRDRTCDPFAEPERLSVAEAFLRHAGIDLLATLDASGEPDAAALRAAMAAAGLKAGEGDTWSDMLSRVLVEKVEPHLGHGRPTILDRYPAAEAALARRAPDDARVAERFELYACGVELANGFGELTDPAEQRRRFQAEMAEKARVYGESYPLDEDLLAALAIMPPASGIAMGFDRLVMLATGAPRIDDVIWAPVP